MLVWLHAFSVTFYIEILCSTILQRCTSFETCFWLVWIYYIPCINMLSEYGFAKVNCSPSGIFDRGLQDDLKHSLECWGQILCWCHISCLVSCGHNDSVCTYVLGDAENVPPLTWLRYILNARLWLLCCSCVDKWDTWNKPYAFHEFLHMWINLILCFFSIFTKRNYTNTGRKKWS